MLPENLCDRGLQPVESEFLLYANVGGFEEKAYTIERELKVN